MEKQVVEYASGNEMAAMAIRQIGYDLMGYYPITPSPRSRKGWMSCGQKAGRI